MKNIVIVGAGDIGQYISLILSTEGYNIILIDNDAAKLERVGWEMDIATRVGSGTDWQLLDDLLELSPDFFIALTSNDEINLVACSIAKHLGFPRTIARVHDNRFLNRSRLDFFRIFDVDSFICPELLVAHDIVKYMMSPGSVTLEHFAHGAVQMRTLKVPKSWSLSGETLAKLKIPDQMIIGMIARGEGEQRKIIFPHGGDVILPEDEVTFVGENSSVSDVHEFLGIQEKAVKSVVIIGGSLTALNLAQILERWGIGVRILEKDFDRCGVLADKLPNTIVIHHDGMDLDFLKSEKIGDANVFVACTRDDATNILAARLGKEVGCENVILLLSNVTFAPLIHEMGVQYNVSPRISAANHVLSEIFSKTVTELVSVYDNRVEVMEVKVSNHSKLVGIPLSELGPYLPKDFLIAMIQNRGRILVPNGNRILSPGDTVVLITDPKHVPEIERLF